MTAPPVIRTTRLAALDGVRAVAITLLFADHLAFSRGGSGSFTRALDTLGGGAVSTFFVLSGFLITMLLLREQQRSGTISIKRFYLRRAIRILPPAFVYIAALSLLQIFDPNTVVSRNELLGSALFVRNLQHGSLFTAHYYTLSIEEQFYLCWPLVLFLMPNRFRLRTAAFLFFLAPVWRQVNIELFSAPNVNWARFDLRYDAMIAGAISAITLQTPDWFEKAHRIVRHGGLMLSIALAVFLGALFVQSRVPGVIAAGMPSLQIAGMALAILILAERASPIADRVMSLRPVVWVGAASYSLYIWQQLFFVHPHSSWMFTYPWNLACAFAAGIVSCYVIERPAMSRREAVESWLAGFAARRGRTRDPLHEAQAEINPPVPTELIP